MAESKVDYSQLIGFLFLMAAFVSFLFISPSSEEEIDIQVEENIAINDSFNANQDSAANEAEFSENIVKIEEESFIVENENVILKFSNKGAKISELTLKDYNDSSGNLVRLLKNNQSLGLSFFNINGVRFDSNTVMFNYKSFDNQNSKVVEFEYLNNLGGKILYRYVIPNQGYLLNFEIETQGLNNIVGTNRKMDLVWDLDSRRQSKSVDYENRYTYINYKDQDGKINRNIDEANSRTSLITDEVRVYKGGSWKDRAYWLDPAQRRYLPQYIATDYIGFRCAMSRLGQKSKIKKTARHKRGR